MRNHRQRVSRRFPWMVGRLSAFLSAALLQAPAAINPSPDRASDAEPPPLAAALRQDWPTEDYFTPREREAFSGALGCLGMLPGDLGFCKRPVFNERTILEYGPRLPLVDLALDRPLGLPAACAGLGRLSGRTRDLATVDDLLTAARGDGRGGDTQNPVRGRQPVEPEDLAAAIERLHSSSIALARHIDQAWEQTDACSLRGHAAAADAPGQALADVFEGVVVHISDEVRRPFFRAIDNVLALPAQNRSLALGTARHPSIAGTLVALQETPAGLLIVGGPGPNVYRRDLAAAFILDLGGNDTYACPVAVADSLTPVSWCLDLGGDDLYLDPGTPTQAAALGGIAVLVDVAGNDSYRCADIGQASALLGTAVLADLAGDDIYLGKEMVQAFATGGDACLLDLAGDDTYRAARFAQASSQILGVAVLADHQGDDVYSCGGDHLHKPLMPENYQSFSQGFSIGERYGPGGGVALLADQSGNDLYQAEVFGIATGYWLSLGMLFDAQGHDTYKGHIYTMGSGVHLAAGILMDLAGNDTYTAGTGVAQGSGHDFAVGMLLDRAGDDRYLAGTGLSQGSADENSVAILLDSAGRDLYACGDETAQGSGQPRYGAPSVALFLDLEDRGDVTTSGAPAPALRLREGHGVRLSLPASSGEAGPPSDPADHPDRLEISDESLAGLWGYARLWQVGRNEWAVHESRRRLIARGREAVDFIVGQKIDETQIYAVRAMRTVLGALQEISLDPLAGVLAGGGLQARRNAMEVLAGFDDPRVAVVVFSYLDDEDPAIVQHAIRIQGRHAHAPAIQRLADFLAESARDPYLRVAAAQALGAFDDSIAVHALEGFLDREAILPLRHACTYALSGTPRGCVVLRDLLQNGDPIVRAWAARGLFRSAAEEDRRALTQQFSRETDLQTRHLIAHLLASTP